MSIKAYVRLLRPHQWLKNLMLFFPPFMGGVLFSPGVFQKGVLPFAIFCLASSASYILNDLVDCTQDRLHPQKRFRPIACGDIPGSHALWIAAGLMLVSLSLAMVLSGYFLAWLLVYLLLSAAYSLALKHQPVFDIFCIASGFVFRLFAGGEVFAVKVSDWLFLSVLLLALFLSAGKRLGEQLQLGEDAGGHRRSLERYPPGVLDAFMLISGASVLVTYTLYVIAKHRLVYTVPLCCFGLFRYILIVKQGKSADPTDSLVKDPVMFMVGLLWGVFVAGSIYWGSG